MSKTKKSSVILFGLFAVIASAVLLCSPILASANSAPSIWHGGTASGSVLTASCPLTVEYEKLTFDISEYPKNYYDSVDEFLSYDGKVTAEYTFYNPEDYDVTATLMFPFGSRPIYSYIYNDEYESVSDDIISQKYDITLNGDAIEKNIRHSYFPYRYSSDFDTKKQLSTMSKSYIDHEFYSPDMPVTKYTYSARGITSSQYQSPYAAFKLNVDASKTRIATQYNNGMDTIDGYKYIGHFTDYYTSNTVYAIGEPPPSPPEWTIFEDGSCRRAISGKMVLTSTETVTLEQFLLDSFDANSSVSASDFYNAGIAALDRSDYECAYVGNVPDISEDELMRWYEYDITVPARSRAVNTVTAPIYPTIDGAYDPSVYGYTYYLSPAENWAAFGTLDITVNTPDYIVSSNLEFVRGENGYTASFEGLPEGELELYVCTEDIQYPSRTGEIVLTVVIVVIVMISVCPIIGAAIVVITYLVQQNKKKQTKQ